MVEKDLQIFQKKIYIRNLVNYDITVNLSSKVSQMSLSGKINCNSHKTSYSKSLEIIYIITYNSSMVQLTYYSDERKSSVK